MSDKTKKSLNLVLYVVGGIIIILLIWAIIRSIR